MPNERVSGNDKDGGEAGMSVKQMAIVWDLNLAANKKFVLLAYADHADDEGGSVYPSLARVAHKTGYSRDQARRISRELAADELMVKVADATHNKGAEYRLTLQRGSKLPPLTPRGVGANDPPGVGAPMPPEPSVEPSVTPTGQAAPASHWEDLKTGQKQANLISYLHQRHTERDLDPPTPRQKERLSGELRTQINQGAAKADLLFALDKIVEAKRRGVALELYQALSDGQKPYLRAVPDEPARPRKRVIS